MFPTFLSVVVPLRNRLPLLPKLLRHLASVLRAHVTHYELLVVDNASNDGSTEALREICRELPNVQVYVLAKELDALSATWVGIENAIGDFVATIDPLTDDITFLPQMMTKAMDGIDVVFARNDYRPQQKWRYRVSAAVFHRIYRWSAGVDLAKEASTYRLLSRKMVNYILRHPQPALAYQYLPASSGFTRKNLSYRAQPTVSEPKNLRNSIDRGLRLLVSSTTTPMRLITGLSLFGASSNLLYSIYVIVVGLVKKDIQPGWVSLSLQQSGMFFLVMLVLLVLGEYILHTASLSNSAPSYHISQEFTSNELSWQQQLNVETPQPREATAVKENGSD